MAWTCGRSRKLKRVDTFDYTKYIMNLNCLGEICENLPNNVEKTLDIGFGTGDSVMEGLLQGNIVIGCEIFKPAIVETIRKIRSHDQRMQNVNSKHETHIKQECINRNMDLMLQRTFLFMGFMDDLFSIIKYPLFDQVKILFPDPWPKQKHSKRRCYQIPFLDLKICRLLKNGGKFIFASDIKYMHDNMRKAFDSYKSESHYDSPYFDIKSEIYNTYDSCPYKTSYCKKGFSAGRSTYEMVAIKK